MEENDMNRHRPAEKRTNNDPYVRDEDAKQPGVNTISSSDTDQENQHITKTGADSFRTNTVDDDRADTSFDEVGDK